MKNEITKTLNESGEFRQYKEKSFEERAMEWPKDIKEYPPTEANDESL